MLLLLFFCLSLLQISSALQQTDREREKGIDRHCVVFPFSKKLREYFQVFHLYAMTIFRSLSRTHRDINEPQVDSQNKTDTFLHSLERV